LSCRCIFAGPALLADTTLPIASSGARVYEQVLREGNEDDVRCFIDVDGLIDLWDEVVLPRHVRQAWADWLRRHRGVSLSS
jgi:hypothetical protein